MGRLLSLHLQQRHAENEELRALVADVCPITGRALEC